MPGRTQVAVGQSLRFRGSWVEHKQYGSQLRAEGDFEELALSGDAELVAYLGGGAIPGVGPVTAHVGRSELVGWAAFGGWFDKPSGISAVHPSVPQRHVMCQWFLPSLPHCCCLCLCSP